MSESKESLEARVKTLEALCGQYNKQLHALKRHVEDQISDMQHSVDGQVDEIRQIIIQQDLTYRERIRRMDARIEQLSDLALRLARNQCGVAALGGLALMEGLDKPPPLKPEVAFTPPKSSPEGTLTRSMSGRRRKSERPKATKDSPGCSFTNQPSLTVTEVLQSHSEKIEEVFYFYTGLKGYSEKLRRTMDLDVFAKMMKDAGISCASYTAKSNLEPILLPSELLWMHIIHKLQPDAHLVTEARSGWELRGDQFPTALQVVAFETYGRRYPEMSEGTLLEVFLLQDLFPGLKVGSNKHSSMSSIELYPDIDMVATLEDYSTEAVAKVVRKWAPALRDKYAQYVARQQLKGRGLTLSSLFDMAKDHLLLPFTSKHVLRLIFNHCAEPEAEGAVARDPSVVMTRSPSGHEGIRWPLSCRQSSREPGISVEAFTNVLKGVAQVIYGGPHCTSAYPTPESRMQKLLAKLLQPP